VSQRAIAADIAKRFPRARDSVEHQERRLGFVRQITEARRRVAFRVHDAL
jgi:hypothetical protein